MRLKKVFVGSLIIASMMFAFQSSLQAEAILRSPQSNVGEGKEEVICTAQRLFELHLISDKNFKREMCLNNKENEGLYPIYKSSALALERVSMGEGSLKAYFVLNIYREKCLVIDLSGAPRIIIGNVSDALVETKKCLVIKQSGRPDIITPIVKKF